MAEMFRRAHGLLAPHRPRKQIARATMQAQLFPESRASSPTRRFRGPLCLQARSVRQRLVRFFFSLGRNGGSRSCSPTCRAGGTRRCAWQPAGSCAQPGRRRPEDPLRALRQVNRLLRRRRSRSGQFATMFFGVWSDASRRLNFTSTAAATRRSCCARTVTSVAEGDRHGARRVRQWENASWAASRSRPATCSSPQRQRDRGRGDDELVRRRPPRGRRERGRAGARSASSTKSSPACRRSGTVRRPTISR